MEKNIYFTDYTTGTDRNIHKLRDGDIIYCDGIISVITAESDGYEKQPTLFHVIKQGSKYAFDTLDPLESGKIKKIGHSEVFNKRIKSLDNLPNNSFEISQNVFMKLSKELITIISENEMIPYIIE